MKAPSDQYSSQTAGGMATAVEDFILQVFGGKMGVDIMPESKILTVFEVAQILRISRTHAYHLVKQGVIPSIKIGRSVRVYEKAFIEWLEKSSYQSDIISLSEPQERGKPWPSGIREISSKKVMSGM
ncbi:helix-turn-helix domain-containing protein [Desulfotomaculum copahuensis]|uniref:helix-turn-helix domain-containing protein n=1 Tax=Desulfotomaculum copahuensis TaxID=1838280 RepID=UPI00191BBCDF|nr:helix-turn-helix domain-containing protein [Desulfotomaculum copahuensis]